MPFGTPDPNNTHANNARISRENSSPFHSVQSDVTMDDYYFDEHDNDNKETPSIPQQHRNITRNLSASPLEYSEDDSGDDFDAVFRRQQQQQGSKSNSNVTQINYTPNDKAIVGNNNDEDYEDDDIERPFSSSIRNKISSQYTNSIRVGNLQHHTDDDDDEDGVDETNWMQRWAYSFRSPLMTPSKKKRADAVDSLQLKQHHKRQGSNGMEEYPHFHNNNNRGNQERGQWQDPFRIVQTTTGTGSGSGTIPPPPFVLAGALLGSLSGLSTSAAKASTTIPGPPILQTTAATVNSSRSSNRTKRTDLNNSEQSPLLGGSFTSTKSARLHVARSGAKEQQQPSGGDVAAAAARMGRPASGGGVGNTFVNSKNSNSNNKPSGSQTAAVQVAATFLQDYEANRPPTFGSSSTVTAVTTRQISLYHIKHSMLADVIRVLAALAFSVGCFLEGFSATQIVEQQQQHFPFNWILLTGLNLFAIVVFFVDIWMHRELRGSPRLSRQRGGQHVRTPSAVALLDKHNTRTIRSERLIQPLIIFCIVLAVENVAKVALTRQGDIVLFSSVFKPLVLFYVSAQARDAFAAVRSILRIVLRVLIMELFLILMFAAVACRLFQKHERFRSLDVAWLSLFELATAVVNPSIWMPIYKESQLSALFFIFFMVTAVFYLHSLVLSVVFQTYIQAAAEIHELNASDREDAVHFAFLALLRDEQSHNYGKDSDVSNLVRIRDVRHVLRLLRPHYSTMKINALIEIVDPSGQGVVDYATFRTKIRQALNASIRTARNATNLAMSVELVAVAVAIVNCIYVILVSSPYQGQWFEAIETEAGCLITLVASFELLIRFNPLRIPDFTPLTRLNATFDGTALVAAAISCVGIAMYLAGHTFAMEYILIGRAIDMIRTMRFFHIFRDIVRRTSDVLPALRGPLILVVTAMHVFVYIGLVLWGGSVQVGQHDGDIFPLYDLNNFNSYREGAVTMFQVIAVNDWYAIADVFLLATRNSSMYIVYPFFIIANLICVSIMLNVLTAFFVESFVTKLHDDKDAPAESTATMHKDQDCFDKQSNSAAMKSSSESKTSQGLTQETGSGFSDNADHDRVEFDVYERQGFDKIMQTVAGSVYHGDSSRDVCSYLEIFESLTPGRETVGYLVCDQQTLDRFGNRRFKTKAIGYLDENKLHSVVTGIHTELLALGPRSNIQDRSIVRTFPHKREAGKLLEISAALIRRHPALSLFVSRTVVHQQQKGPQPFSGKTKR